MTWIFTYGTLMGDNALRYHEGTRAQVRGYERKLAHASTHRWGTPQHPCPVIGLVPGADCWGVAFDVPRREERQLFRIIQRREGQDEFDRKKVDVLVDERPQSAVAWVTKPRLLKTPRWSVDDKELHQAFFAAHGLVGTGVEYIRTLIHALERWRIHDRLIESLWKSLQPHSNPKG